MVLKKKVLIVDDDTSILEALEFTFESLGFKPHVLSSGEGVFDAIGKFKPDVVVLDIVLAGLGGDEICKKLKADKKTAGLPVVMISAYPWVGQSAHNCGADDFLEKPFDMEHLVQKVKRLA